MTRAARLALLLLAAPLALAAGEAPLRLVTHEGEPVELARPGQGEAIVLHFWASWCPECRSELPALARAARACAGSPVRVVAVNVGEDAQAVERFRAEHPFDLPVLRDPEGAVWRGEARGLPANLVWTRESRRAEVGPRDVATWQRILGELGCAAAEPDPSTRAGER